MRKGRFFTLLELLVGLTLIFIAAGFGGWKIVRLVEKKRFDSDLEKLYVRLITCQRLAINMQADWRGILEKSGDEWLFVSSCEEQPQVRPLPVLKLHSLTLSFEGKEATSILFDFSSTGEVDPTGALIFKEKKGGLKKEWKLPLIFQKEEGDAKKRELGPLHPSILSG